MGWELRFKRVAGAISPGREKDIVYKTMSYGRNTWGGTRKERLREVVPLLRILDIGEWQRSYNEKEA